MSTSSIPPLQFTFSGIIAPSVQAILEGAKADINSAFGNNLSFAQGSAEKQLATSHSAIVDEKNAQFLYVASMFDPSTSEGIYQDALGKIYNMARLPATQTTVTVRCHGRTGVVIGIGALVLDSGNGKYVSIASGTIPALGYVDLPFVAQEYGPMPCPAGFINRIFQSIAGWDSAENLTDGAPGRYVESRADFELRRKNSVAKNALGSLGSIYAEVFSVTGVTDVYVTQNFEDTAQTVGGISLAPHSIYVCAAGGLAQDVGAAILLKTPIGCNYNGNTSITIADNVNYAPPYPAWTVKYEIPSDQQIYFAIAVQNFTGSANAVIETAIKNAVILAFNGGDGGERARIGSLLLAQRYIVPISKIGAVAISSVFLGGAASPTGISYQVGIDKNPATSGGNISVVFI